MNHYCNRLLGVCAGAMLLTAPSFAQEKTLVLQKEKPNSVYLSTSMDSYILSTSMLEKGGSDAVLTTPRFTAFLHLGMNVNYDFTPNFGIFSGLNIKNIGFIEKIGDSTVKRRTYTFGIPLGIKIGKLTHGNFFMLGGGVDFPFNYKEKGFVKRSDKTKFNEWFSQRTPAVLPYVFVGAHFHPGLSVKLQYYPGNYLNPDFKDSDGLYPYKDYKVNLILATVGIDINFRPKELKEKIKVMDVDTAMK